MTYKVTVWDEHKRIGMVRDYRLPIWNGYCPQYQCHAVTSLNVHGKCVRPWHVEFEGEVPKGIVYTWAPMCMHPKADIKNITVNGEVQNDNLQMGNG